jgi:hypothetical protein
MSPSPTVIGLRRDAPSRVAIGLRNEEQRTIIFL